MDARSSFIVDVLRAEFGELMAADPYAFERKFRKMAGNAFAFYRGSACLFYADVHGQDDPYLDERTSRVWIHGDLHAENFGTYMNAAGQLVFNVNDFDEAYVGPFTWDLKRFAASIALIGYGKALSDEDISVLVRRFAAAYLREIRVIAAKGDDAIGELTLANTDGPLKRVLQEARLNTRTAMLDRQTTIDDYDRRFSVFEGVYEVDDATRSRVLDAFYDCLATMPSDYVLRPTSIEVKDVVLRKGVGIGSAGLPSYNLLLEGNSQALENDVVLYMKQGQVPAVSRVVTDSAVASYFAHQGQRTAESQRALQAHADPWLGYATLDGIGQVVAEVSPYASDLDWTELDDMGDIGLVVGSLGAAVARMHAVADDESSHTLVDYSTEEAIAAAVGEDDKGFAEMLVEFAHGYGVRARTDHQLFVDVFRNGQLPLR
ncbi:hypothetical protein Afil01_55850 [Actinorhabdospora filicis]|uniref:DUF2252 domain-containing protein n=1 Tax=Actinorhabdospora filicis TaxID=1785913 RepID=A0A9W6SR15_9ACTN|nr:DUF2252 domain-containing protein [Actinorhabdospora filicis]GLZ80778.1 hypothetical protein Afil01_55850 [Actinorhabdospora filicis]